MPYINPGYCARCEECMHSCPSTAIKYSSRKKAFKLYRRRNWVNIINRLVDERTIELNNKIIENRILNQKLINKEKKKIM